MTDMDIFQKIMANKEFSEASPCYLSVYRREQCYGGPEEGGWWYDRIEWEGGVPFASREAAERYLESAKAEVEAVNRAEAPNRAHATANLPDAEGASYPEGYIPRGWGDGGERFVEIEDEPGESDNTRQPRPRYE
jgi:hypothetical protein